MSTSSTSTDAQPSLTLRTAQWPAVDRQLWQAAQQPAPPFRGRSIASTWSPASRGLRESVYGRWLAWLDRNGSLNPALRPSERVTVERIAAYVEQLQARVASVTTATQVGALLCMLRALEPEVDLPWLRVVYHHLKATARPSRDKRGTVVPAKDLYDLGIILMEVTDADANLGYLAGFAYRDGLMIAILAAAPVRMANLCAIEIGRHLTHRDGIYWLEFSAEETKNEVHIERPLPQHLTPYIDRYLKHYRDIPIRRWIKSTTPPTRALWVNRYGEKMDASAIRTQIKLRTARAFGRKIWPHLFRDCAATSIAIEDPENLALGADLLSNELATLKRYYNQAQMLQTGRVYQRHMLELKREARRALRKDKHPRPAARHDDSPAF